MIEFIHLDSHSLYGNLFEWIGPTDRVYQLLLYNYSVGALLDEFRSARPVFDKSLLFVD